MSVKPEEVLNFWYHEISPDRWFKDDPSLDTLIKDRFLSLYESAVSGELDLWANTPEGTLALLLLYDQFPRRMFRGVAKQFDTDERAIDLARQAIIKHYDDRIDKSYKLIFYLPFVHSENIGDQRLALFYIRERTKEEGWLILAERNFEIVQKFGRFPDRNSLLGRTPTADEDRFLKLKRTP